MDKAEVDKLEIEFKAKISKTENCLCDACHDISRVMKITLPHTKYHGGKGLTAEYNEYWLCARCRTKLSKALDWPEEE